MKPQKLAGWTLVSSLALLLALLFTLAVAAQEPARPVDARRGGPQPPQSPPFLDWEGGKPFARPLAPGDRRAEDLNTPAVDLGQPGLSFRYVETLGETETAYLEDNNHFYDVEGLGIDGNNIWVTDSWSDRVLKFAANGNFLQKIGKAGFRDATGTPLDYVTDVAADSGGNVWVVDGGAAHVVKFDSGGNRVSELGQAWNSGSDNSHFNDPIGIAFDGAGNIYVSDSGLWGDYGNHRVQIFDSSGNHLATIGQTGNPGPGNNQFRQPRHIAIYGNRLYVADAGNHRVQVFDISTPGSPTYVATLGVTGVSGSNNSHFDFPEGVGADANYLYVADSNNNRVQVFNRSTRAYVTTIGTGFGQGDYQFNHPTDVVVDSAGRIYVADNYSKRVQQYNSSRTYLRTYGTTGISYVTDGYHYYRPVGVAVGEDGSIDIVEERGHRLVKLNAAGDPLWTVGEPGQNGGDNSHFFGPQDVAVDGSGRVYVAEGWSNHRVQIFDSNGSYYATLGTGEGSGNYKFQNPDGIAIDAAGNIYVADTGNHRVQVYSAQRVYVATLGQTGVSGSDNSHFNSPTDVALDSNGTIYVADEGNDRVQVFDSNRQYVRTIGQTGSPGSDFGRFDGWGPHRLAVDVQNRLYVADSGNNRIQVFDSSGAYLTTVGGSWGSGTGQFRGPFGVAIGPDGALYVADPDNNRIQVFAPGVPGWMQVNINGFGDRGSLVGTLDTFDGQMYAGNWNGGVVWRTADGRTWSEFTPSWSISNTAVFDAVPSGSHLYVGTLNFDEGAEIWRTDGATWEQVAAGGFDTVDNPIVSALASFSGAVYAATANYSTGVEIWGSPTGDAGTWTQVNDDGFGSAGTPQDITMDVYSGCLYVGLGRNGVAELWRSDDGTTWNAVFTDGLAANNTNVSAMAGFDGQFYIGLRNVTTGGEVWRSANGLDWTSVFTGGLGNPWNQRPYGLIVFDSRLYLVFSNGDTGAEVWRTADGSTWEQVATGGWGDSNNSYSDYYDKAATVFNDRLYIGTFNDTNGGEVWKKTVTADFVGSPTLGAPPLTVTFANLSAGDYTTSLWTFGDGDTSAEISPTHVYDLGVYTVSLTVGDGVDTSAITRTAYIRALYPVYLPLLMRNQ
jgi:DNA-binding beta-propeller fold protein YncE